MVEIDEILYKLDKFIVKEIWLRYNGISLEDVSKHLSMDSITSGNFRRNFEKISREILEKEKIDKNSGHE